MGGVGEKIIAVAARVLQVILQSSLIHAQARRQDGKILDPGAFGQGVFANTIDRIVIIKG